MVDLWYELLRIIELANEKIEEWEWEIREVITLIENGVKLMEEKKLSTRKPEIWKKLAGYRTYILKFLN